MAASPDTISISAVQTRPRRLAAVLDSTLIDCLLLSCWVVLLGAAALPSAEFLRHTEADRALIAWEMNESGNYLIPHLLGSAILTKPPLYYWLTAFFMTITGSTAEWAARLPSLAAAILLVIAQYLFIRRALANRLYAFVSALMLSASFGFFLRSVLAEIDMVYSLFTAAALYAGLLALLEASLFWVFAAYVSLAAAFLTKGPPAVVFFAAVQVVFLLSMNRRHIALRSHNLAPGRLLTAHLAGAAVCLGICLLWVLPVADRLGWKVLVEAFRVEILERAVGPARLSRGPLFYICDFFAALAPWSVFVLGALLTLAVSEGDRRRARQFWDKHSAVLLYTFISVALPLTLLSLAEGKSSRYWFGLHAFGINLCFFLLLVLKDSAVEHLLFRAGRIAGYAGCGCFLLAGLLLHLPGVPRLNAVGAGAALAASLWYIGSACGKRDRKGTIGALVLAALALRAGQLLVYDPHRNSVRSVKAAAAAIDETLPAGAALYTFELHERWTTYYLKHLGRTSMRLTDYSCRRAEASGNTAFLMFNTQQEAWRLNKLQSAGISYRPLLELKAGKDTFTVLELPAHALCVLEPPRELSPQTVSSSGAGASPTA